MLSLKNVWLENSISTEEELAVCVCALVRLYVSVYFILKAQCCLGEHQEK